MIKKITVTLLSSWLFTQQLFAQSNVEMADVMRSNGKIYVVVVVAAIVLFGLIGYMITIDRKISRIEKEVKNKKQI